MVEEDSCIKVYLIENEHVWRNTQIHEKMIEEDTLLLNNIQKPAKIFFLSSIISFVIQIAQPLPSQAVNHFSSGLTKMQDKKKVYFSEDKTETTDSSNNSNKKYKKYVDSLNGNTYTQHFSSIDYRRKPITVAGRSVLLKPVSAQKLYNALAFLEFENVLTPDQVAIKEVFSKNGVSVDNFNLMSKFNPKTRVFSLRAGQNQEKSESQQNEPPTIDNNMQEVRYGTILTNVLLVILSALLVGIIVLNVVDMLGTQESDPVKYTFNRSMYQHFINLNRKEIGHIGYIAKLLGDFCANYPKIELAPTEAINRMCQDYLTHFEVAMKIKKDIRKLIKRNAILSETSKESQRIYDAYMQNFVDNHK